MRRSISSTVAPLSVLNLGAAHRRVSVALIIAPLLIAVGCAENKLTRDNFDLIRIGLTDSEEVIEIIGEPDMRINNEAWHWADRDEHVEADVWFNQRGIVRGKRWWDGKTGEVLGGDPDGPGDAPGEVRETHIRTRTYSN